ncbi:hypothetical protein IR083_21975 [Dysgonomonas sp. GY75]|uniref:hypothetical protein n=1 Tax=Dysgonomonas sp. GY75 TaxID=2780419 RepID=UPI0018846F96|nr:hypothetical protein [Dysgonomonas sp. GY75]MBF0651487.1 hypothetical protein [Dysgonomonas sp. GY75]
METIGGIIVVIIGIAILLFLLKKILFGLGYIWAIVGPYVKPMSIFGLLGGVVSYFAISNFLTGMVIGGIIGLILKIAGALDTKCPDCGSKNTSNKYYSNGIEIKVEGGKHCDDCGKNFYK